MKPTLFLMIGLPGSGKSTLCQKMDKKSNTIWISRDNIRLSLLKEGDPYFSKEKQVIKKFIENILFYLKEGYDVYADATHLNISSRRKILEPLKRSNIDCYITGLWMNTPFEKCLYNNNLRTGIRKVPYDSMMNMENAFIEPSYHEGFDSIYKVNLSDAGKYIVTPYKGDI